MDLLLTGVLIGMCVPRLCRRFDAWLNAGDTADPEALHALRRLYEGRE
jgi:hypothetical protein